MKKVLFLCSQNRLRSPTAEQVFASHKGIEVASAGLNNDAENPTTPELIAWADYGHPADRDHELAAVSGGRSNRNLGTQQLL
jgi:predicted protein tyrosine phosphatase